jgi:threonine dehydrogenase-like Zn-dependent dehydrogenase
MPVKTIGVRLYGRRDLRLEEYELPEMSDDEILAEVVSNSICMSSHKAVEQGAQHKRVPSGVDSNPVIIGHEFAGRILKVGSKWADQFEENQKFGIQPALNYKGSLDAPGYSYQWIGGNAQKIVIPREVMITDCLLPYEGDAYFKASLAEPMSCIVGAFRAQYHHAHPGRYEHEFGIKKGGNCALLAAAGPMGEGAIDMALHGTRLPNTLLVTDIDQRRLDRTESLFPVEKARKLGVNLIYLNPNDLPGGQGQLLEYVRELTEGEMMDDVFVFFPNEKIVEQADEMLGRDGCLNFFAGPQRKDFKSKINFYNVHYERHHIVGTSGGNTEDMRIALRLMGEGRLNPAGMITHVGGLDSAAQTILDLPDMPGGKKLVYTHISMPMTAIADFAEMAEEADEPLKSVYRELGTICKRHGDLWSKEAEDFLLGCGEIRLESVG